METRSERRSRRVFLIASLSVGVAWAVALVSGARAACGGDGAITPPRTEGPYFKPNSPARASLVERAHGRLQAGAPRAPGLLAGGCRRPL